MNRIAVPPKLIHSFHQQGSADPLWENRELYERFKPEYRVLFCTRETCRASWEECKTQNMIASFIYNLALSESSDYTLAHRDVRV